MENLPNFIEGQIPQSPFDALLTRITESMGLVSNARCQLETFIEGQKAPAYADSLDKPEAPKPINHYPSKEDYKAEPELSRIRSAIVHEFFNAIAKEDNESVALLIQYNIVTANTIGRYGQTPLLAAIRTRSIPIITQLLEFGADPNAFGSIPTDERSISMAPMRTPLMLAASINSLPIVKLLLEGPYVADDALIAPDGQLALRLAAEKGHRTIVEYLPSRSGGGFRRFRIRNAHNIRLIGIVLESMGGLLRFFLWHLPKFFVWSIPKHLIALPVINTCKWCWRNRQRFGRWCRHHITEMPKRVARFGKAVWKAVKKVPKAVAEIGKGIWKVMTKILPAFLKDTLPIILKDVASWVWKLGMETLPTFLKDIAIWLWKFATETLPRWLQKIAMWFWELLTLRILKAVRVGLEWIWNGIESLVLSIWNIVRKFFSFLHVIFIAAMTFLRNATLKDIWNGFCDLLSAIFVTFPKALWSWLRSFGEAFHRILVALFDFLGEFLWNVIILLKFLVLFFPRRIWMILGFLADSLVAALHEIRVWFNPKLCISVTGNL